MDESRLDSVLSHASDLINSEQFNMLVEQKSSGYRRKNGKKGGNGGGDLSAFEAAAGFGGQSRSSRRVNEDVMPTVSPEEIRESFRKMPAMSGGAGVTSVPASYYATQQRQVIQEQQYAPQTQYQAQPQAIDYNYIKFLINECIKENLKQLNESASLSTLKMAGGNKIEFVDSKGNVYEGVLRRVK